MLRRATNSEVRRSRICSILLDDLWTILWATRAILHSGDFFINSPIYFVLSYKKPLHHVKPKEKQLFHSHFNLLTKLEKSKCWPKISFIGHNFGLTIDLSRIFLFIRNFKIFFDFTKKLPMCTKSRCRAIVNIYVIYEAEGNFWSNKPIFFLFVVLLNIATHLLYIFMTTFFLMYDSRPGESIFFLYTINTCVMLQILDEFWWMIVDCWLV